CSHTLYLDSTERTGPLYNTETYQHESYHLTSRDTSAIKFGLLIHLIDQFPVFLIDNSTLYFQRPCQFATLDSQLVIQQSDALYLFILRQVICARGNLAFKQIDYAWIMTKLGPRFAFDSFQLQIGFNSLPIRHNQRDRKSTR